MKIKNLAIVAAFSLSLLMIFFVCLTLTSCDKPEPQKEAPPPKVEQPAPVPTPAPNPFADNPFVHDSPKPGAVPAPVPAPHPNTAVPAEWDQVGGEYKLNETWSIFIWRDHTNHNVCYFYNVFNNEKHEAVTGHGMSCVKE